MSDESRAIVVDTSREVLDTIVKASRDPAVDVGKLAGLLDLQERLLADQRHTAFMSAMTMLQEELPQISKSGSIVVDGALRSRYAKIEDIDTVVRPICAKHGFSFGFDSKPPKDGFMEYSCDMQHRDGHVVRKTISLPIDNSGRKNPVQSVGSTTSYARRYLLSMHLNLITRDEDDDGNGGRGPVSAEQAAELRTKLAEVGGNEARFLNWLAAESFETVPAASFKRALRFIDEKRGRK